MWSMDVAGVQHGCYEDMNKYCWGTSSDAVIRIIADDHRSQFIVLLAFLLFICLQACNTGEWMENKPVHLLKA